MFKRITKKQRKREHEEELGLDDDARQMFGLQDTDSDESSSQSELDSGDELDRGAEADMRTEWLAADGGSSDDDDDGDEEGLDFENLDDEPPLSLEEAMKNPIYDISSEKLKDERACIACPKKLLKNDKMVELHLSSAAHVRRFRKFCELAKASNDRTKNPRRIAASIAQNPIAETNTEGVSKRSLKRKQKLESIKRKREKTKQIMQRKKRKRAKKEAEVGAEGKEGKTQHPHERVNSDTGADKNRPSTSTSDKQTSDRPRKRRKVSDPDSREAPRESAGSTQGGDSTKTGNQTEVVIEVAAPAPKPSKVKRKKTKAKGKSESNAKVESKPDSNTGASGGEGKLADSISKQHRGESPKRIRYVEDNGTAKRNNDSGGPRAVKTRDLEKLRTKGRMGRAGAGKFAKLSQTRPVKDKSQRKPQSQGDTGDTARNSFAPRKPTRYFDEPEDGTPAEPKKFSIQKRVKKTKSQEGKGLKRNNSAKGDGGNRDQKAERHWTAEKAADDLVIFD